MKNGKLVCLGKTCASTENTLIDGKKLKFYDFPTEKKLKDAWKKLLNITDAADGPEYKKVLCELHFDKKCFDKDRNLKPMSIPTWTSIMKPVKYAFVCEKPPVKSNNFMNNQKMDISNQSFESNDVASKKVKPFRLTIQIDKVKLKPRPKCKKVDKIKINFVSPRVTNDVCQSLGQTFKLRNGKQLPAYNQCLVCRKVFLDPTDLHNHLKEHFKCDICNSDFTSIKSHKKHYTLHQSGWAEYPYKCHYCSIVFINKKTLSEHPHILNPPNDKDLKSYSCKECNVSFKNDKTYKKHLQIHKQESCDEDEQNYKTNSLDRSTNKPNNRLLGLVFPNKIENNSKKK